MTDERKKTDESLKRRRVGATTALRLVPNETAPERVTPNVPPVARTYTSALAQRLAAMADNLDEEIATLSKL